MKNKFTILIITIIVMTIFSCKKGSIDSPLTGKWQETKLRIYSTNFNYDTTYYQPFNNLDYIEFLGNNTCQLSIDHTFYLPDSPGDSKTPQTIPQSVGSIKYASVGNGKYVFIVQTEISFGGYNTDTLSMINANTLLSHNAFYGPLVGPTPSMCIDTYYQK